MQEKIHGPIKTISLDVVPYCGESFNPTLINFLYGSNGVGKTTIARVIKENAGITWQVGLSPDDYCILVYDQQFMDRNFQDCSNLKGVFTVGEDNIAIRNRISDLDDQLAQKNNALSRNAAEQQKLLDAKNSDFKTFQESCWSITRQIRLRYPGTQAGYKRDRLKTATRILNMTDAVRQDQDTLDLFYCSAFDKDARQYPLFQYPGTFHRLKRASRGFELLGKPITGSGGTPFSDFLKRLHAMPWVTEGHRKYHMLAGDVCPYCQQILPSDFEEQLSACYDEQYRQDISALEQYRDAYDKDMHEFVQSLRDNLQDPYPRLDLQEFRDKTMLLEKAIDINLQRIDDKIRNPAAVVELESIKNLLAEIRRLIENFNVQIRTNNTIVDNLAAKKQECTAKVWQHLGFMMREQVQEYRAKDRAASAQIGQLQQQAASLREEIRELTEQQRALGMQGVSTKPVMDSINLLLRNAGFQGFSIEEHPEISNVYRIVRPGGQIADHLSEGERSFLAFLYFYHLVKGFGQSGPEQQTLHDEMAPAGSSPNSRDKIVVIDDPVSGMDSSALSLVSSLVRELIKACENNAHPTEERRNTGINIRQIFVLTHNVYFHQEVTYHQEQNYSSVNFYAIRKTANKSAVSSCVRKKANAPMMEENFNPVRNSYAALWAEYKDLNTAIPVLSVIHRILEYYFLQLCGYDGEVLRRRILTEESHRFVTTREDGSEDRSQLTLAASMLSCLTAPSFGNRDGLYFVAEYDSAEPYKQVFRLIFDALGQNQHYNMMMGIEGNTGERIG